VTLFEKGIAHSGAQARSGPASAFTRLDETAVARERVAGGRESALEVQLHFERSASPARDSKSSVEGVAVKFLAHRWLELGRDPLIPSRTVN
jgi:hypothetical protein